MNHFRRLIILATAVMSIASSGRFGFGQIKPGGAPPSVVDAAVKDLQSDSPDVRQGAEVRLYALGPEDFPAIEAASKRAGLKPEAAKNLKTIVDTVRPLIGRRTRNARAAAADWQWAERTALAAYDAVGKRNPKWDQAARDAFKSVYEPGESITRFEAIDKAVQLGCDDPLLMSLRAHVTGHDVIAATDGLTKSRYPVTLKVPELAWAGQRVGVPVNAIFNDKVMHFKPDPNAIKMLQTAVALWPEVLTDMDIPDSALIEDAQEMIKLAGWITGETKPTFDQVFAAMEKEPRHTASTLIFKGEYYTEYAWDARGRGTADTVTPEGYRQMQERLVVAADALSKAYDLNPNDPAAPIAMLVVELGQGKGKDVHELWFSRAMKANPDDYKACESRLYYLEPKWRGSPEEMLAFARACRDSNNWYAKMPMLLPDAHERLSKYVRSPEQYFQSPGVWADIQSAYQPLLNAWPDDAVARSKYTYYACMCGQWGEARKQFNQLGDNVDFKAFGDDSKMSDLKEKAMNGGR